MEKVFRIHLNYCVSSFANNSKKAKNPDYAFLMFPFHLHFLTCNPHAREMHTRLVIPIVFFKCIFLSLLQFSRLKMWAIRCSFDSLK